MPREDKRGGSRVERNFTKMWTHHRKHPERRDGARRRKTLDETKADAWIDRDLNGSFRCSIIFFSRYVEIHT